MKPAIMPLPPPIKKRTLCDPALATKSADERARTPCDATEKQRVIIIKMIKLQCGSRAKFINLFKEIRTLASFDHFFH